MSFVDELSTLLKQKADAENASAMAAYMKDRFLFFGVKAPDRKKALSQVIQQHRATLDSRTVVAIAKSLYQQPYREFHYCAIELVTRFVKGKFKINDIAFIEHLISTYSWWDSVDMICKHPLGSYLQQFPQQTFPIIQRYSNADYLWLNRSAILFQLDYKKQTDQALLFALCSKHKDSDEFFIKKAIGWALRAYSDTNPTAVINYVSNTKLSALSEKEALRKVL